MKPIILTLLAVLSIAACNGAETCEGDHCVCPSDDDCTIDCTPGAAECHVQGASGQPVDVQCTDNAECHVMCVQSSSCKVDCGGSEDCDVTCPAGGCTVTGCVDCDVTCGLGGIATHNGTTATCP